MLQNEQDWNRPKPYFQLSQKLIFKICLDLVEKNPRRNQKNFYFRESQLQYWNCFHQNCFLTGNQ